MKRPTILEHYAMSGVWRNPGESGFILLTILLFVGLAAATALYLTMGLRGAGQEFETEYRVTRLKLAAESGLARLKLGLERPGDHFVYDQGRLLRHQVLHVDDLDVALEMTLENGKFDVNTAPLGRLLAVVAKALGDDPIAATVLERLRNAREAKQRIAAVEDLLTVPRRFSGVASTLRAILTVGPGTIGADLNQASPELINALPDLSESDRQAMLRSLATGHMDFEVLAGIAIHDTTGPRIVRLAAEVRAADSVYRKEMIVVYSQSERQWLTLSERTLQDAWIPNYSADH